MPNDATNKRLLILNGGYNEMPLIIAAKRLGYTVYTSGNDKSGEGHQFADGYYPADYSNKESVLNLAIKYNIDVICSASNDFAALSASYAAERLGLPGHDSYAVSKIFHEKDVFREKTTELGFNVPASRAFSDKAEASAYAQKARYPLMIKPADLSGGKGISCIESPDKANDAIDYAFSKTKIGRIVLEDFIQGDQYAFICYLKNRRVVYDCSTRDFASPVNPWLVGSTFGHMASVHNVIRNHIVQDVETLADQYGAADGFLTIQYLLCEGKPFYLETMRRYLGNLHFLALSKETGVDWTDWFIASEAGLPCDKYIEQAHNDGISAGFIIPFATNNGIIRKIEIDDDLKPYVFHEHWLLREGDCINDYRQDKVAILSFACPTPIRDELLAKRNQLTRVVCE